MGPISGSHQGPQPQRLHREAGYMAAPVSIRGKVRGFPLQSGRRPYMCHARKERAEVNGTDQRITSGPAATTAASRGRIHGCTRHARKERAEVNGTDQRITSGPAATTAASRGRIHGCTRIVSRKGQSLSLAKRAPSIHGTVRFELTQHTPPPFAPLTPLPIAWLCSAARADRRASERGHAERM